MSNVMQKLRKKQIILVVLTIVFLVLTSNIVSGSTGGNVSPIIKQNGLVSPNIAANITASHIKEGSGKIESSLYQMYQKQKSSEKSQASAFELNAQENKIQVKKVQVTIGLKYNINQTQAIAKIKALGAHIQTTFKSPITHQNLVQAMIPVSQLSAIADLSFVKVVRLPNKPVLSRIYDEGTGVIKSTLANAAGYTGKRIKVAVIDCGFNLSNPEISGHIVENKSFLVDGDITGENCRHGTATAEIVVDVAPNVSLYLYNVETELELENATNYAISQGVNIISMSMGWFTGKYDGTSPIDEMVDSARQKGILWVNSAGNEAQKHWDGNFTPASNSNYSRWNTFIPNSTDIFNEINFTAGSPIEIYLSWNDWTSYPNYPNQDLNLYLYNSTGYIVAWSTNLQDGSGYTTPTEFIPYVPTYTGPYYIGIYNYNTTRNVHIQLFIGTETDYKLEYDVANNSLINPADANGSLTVGATYWADGVLERFSSQGPTTDGRTKPDVVAPDGVSSSIYGISTGNHSADWANGVGFFGTSASAPNVAGAAALLLEQNQSRSPDQLQTLLENSAVHLGVKGKNNQTGYGIIDVYAALNLSSYPGGSTRIGTCTNIDTPGTYILNTNLTDGSVTGCINITANNVIFDGAGHTISSINANNIAGVYVYNSTKTLTNVTVKNLVATDWSIGIFYNNSKSGSIENNTALNNDFGIFLDTSSSNTLKNNNASDNPYGVVFVNSSNNDLTNNIATLNNVIGIFLFNSSNNDLTNNIANSNNVGGIILFNSSNYNTLTNNTANLNNISGIFLDSYNNNNDLTNNIANSNNVGGIILFNSSNYNTLTNNTANLNNLSGIFLDTSSNYDTLTNNTASSNKQYGIYLNVSSSNTLTSNILTSNLDGIRLDTSNSNVITGDIVTGHTTGTGIWQKNSNNNTLTNNNVSNNKWGIYFENSTNATITSNIAWNNSQYGIDLETSSNNTLSNNTLHDNGWDFNSLSSSSNTIIANSFNNTKASFTYSGDIKVKSSTSPVSSPIGYTSVGKYLNITTITSGWVYLNVSYNNSDVAGLNKSSLLMWRYNGSEWSQVSGTNGINAAQNYVYANFTVSGVGRNIVVTYGSDNLNEVTPAVKDVWVSGNGTELNPSYPTVLPLDSTHNGQIAYIGNGSSIMYDANGNGEVSDSVDYPLYDGVYVLNHVTGVVRFVYDISHHMVSDYTTGSPAFFPGDVANVRGNDYAITDVSNFTSGKVKLGSAITKKITYTPETTLSPDRSVVLTGNYKAFYTVNSTSSTGVLYFYNGNALLGTYSFGINNGGNSADNVYANATVNGSVVIGGSATDKINSISALSNTSLKANYDIYLVKLSNSTASNPWVSMVLVDKNTISTVSDGQSGAMGYGVVWVNNINAQGMMLLMSNSVQLVLGSSVVVPGTENLYKAKYSILQGLDIKFMKTYIQPNGAEWNTSQYNFLTHNIHIKTSDGNVVVTYGSDNLNEGTVAKDVWVSGNGTELNPSSPTVLPLGYLNNGQIAYIGNDSSIMYDANGNGRVSDSVDYPLYDGVYRVNVTGVVRFVYDISHHMVYDYTTGSAAFFPGDVAKVRGNNYAITDVSNFTADKVSLGSAITKKITYSPGTKVSSGNAVVLTGNYKVFYHATNTTNTTDTSGTGILYFYDGNSLLGTYSLAIKDGGNSANGAYASATVSGSTSVVIGGSATDKINSISALSNTSFKANYDIYLVKLSNSTASNPWVSMVLVDKNTISTVSDGQSGAMGYGVAWVNNINAQGMMLLMSNPVQLVLGSSVVVPGTENLYKAKYSILEGLDIKFQKTYIQPNGAEWYAAQYSNFLSQDLKILGSIAAISVFAPMGTTPPEVNIISPLNITYNTSSVILNLSRSDNFGVNTTLYSVYSVDGAANLTYSTPTTVTGLANGTHNIVVFTNDSVGNVNITSVFFSLDNIINESVNNIVANASNNQTNVSTPDIFLNISTVHALVGKVNVTVYSAIPPGVNTSLKVARYVEINVSDNMNDTSGNLSWVYLRESYTSQEVSGLEKSTLRLYWWNPHADNWTRLVKGMNLTAYDGPYVYGAGVNTNANYVWANLSHFSTYGISGSVSPTITSSPPSTGGGGGGGGGAAPVKPAPIKKGVRMINVTSGGIAALVGKFLYFKKEFFVAPSELAGVMGSMGYFPTSAGMVDKLDKELASPVKIIRGDPYIIASKDVLQKYPWAYRVVIARGDLGVDSIAAVAYARALNAPILLVKPGELPSVTENALTKLNTKYTIIIGGPVAVDNAVAAKLPREVRIGGMDRYGTAVKIAEAFETVHSLNTIIITNGLKPDLTAVMLAEYYQAPIIYVKGDVVPEVTKDYLLHHKVNILTVGVSEKAVNTIKELINQ